MSETKHTSGPWHWEEGQSKVFAAWNGKDYVVASVEESHLGWHEDRFCESRERGANARLIAAAPDLLQAAKSIYDWMSRLPIPTDGCTSKMQVLYDAIAKAEGRS